jgi:TM2 domain-containing membrane protein YozV
MAAPAMAAPAMAAPAMAAPAMAAPAMAAPAMAAPAMANPVATQPVALAQPSGPTVIQAGAGGQTSTLLAYVLWFFLGWLGVHHLYIGRGIGIWLLSLISFQGLGLWWFIDLFLIPSSVSKRNQTGQQIYVL